MATRRQFLAAAGAGWAASIASVSRANRQDVQPADRPLNLLVLGGTGFLGPHQIEYALARGHNVTMFNRGRNAGLFGDRVEEIVGDRDSSVGEGLKSLEGDRRFDVVIDNSGYSPRHVRDSAELLKDRCGRYLFTSTVAVYDYEAVPERDGVHFIDRDGPILPTPDPERGGYGPLKAECDRIVLDIYGERATIVRPCYIVGPGDTTDRFTYWVDRLHRGGDVVCPAMHERVVQWIDARDLCPWIIRLAENGTAGVFNGVGPASYYTNEALMHGLMAFAPGRTKLHWPEPALLNELRYPTPMFDRGRIDRYTDNTHALAAGLTLRPLADTVRDLQAWWLSQPEDRRARPRGWPTPGQEAAVLERMRT